ncbi:MAG: hypothetical protein JNL13_12350 [Chitinophagaceae bacterium]|nr:hypothetical protein [Chitinophagaceae bacterium]
MAAEDRNRVLWVEKGGKISAGTVYLLLALAIAEELWLEYFTIGSDPGYCIYIGLLPTAAGCLFLLCYRWPFIVKNYTGIKGVLPRLFLVLFYGLQGILFSYLSFGVLAKTVWNYTNKAVADRQPAELLTCPVISFQQGKNSYIYFLFRDKKEKLNVRYKTLTPYADKDAGLYELRFTARSGIWNYYLVESWSIAKTVQ